MLASLEACARLRTKVDAANYYCREAQRDRMSDDEAYVREAIELARRAVEDGNTPFGSLLVVDDEVVRTATNTTVTDDDIASHPELKLARWAARELGADQRAACTMYTSTEPCPMCATGIAYSGLHRVVYSVSGRSLTDVRGIDRTGIPCEEVIERMNGSTVVDGPVVEDEGLEVHEEFY